MEYSSVLCPRGQAAAHGNLPYCLYQDCRRIVSSTVPCYHATELDRNSLWEAGKPSDPCETNKLT